MATPERFDPGTRPSRPAKLLPPQQTAIQLLKTIKSKGCLTKAITGAITELERPGMTIQCSEALSKVVDYLVFTTLGYSDNIPVLEKLLALGCTLPSKTNSFPNSLVTISLIEKLCACSKEPEHFIRHNALLLLSLGSKRSYQLLTNHLSEQEVIQIIQNSQPYYISRLFDAKGNTTTLPDVCPEVVTLVWRALLPSTTHTLDQLGKKLDRGIKRPFQNVDYLDSEGALIEALIWLNHHSNPEAIQALMTTLPDNHLTLLSFLSLSLGLEQVSHALETDLSPHSETDTCLLHRLINLTRDLGYLPLNVETRTSLTPLFQSLGLPPERLEKLASQRDESGCLPLQVLLENSVGCGTSDPMFPMDTRRFQSWFDFLLEHTPKDALPECLEMLFKNADTKNINYYGALLSFIRAGCDLSKVGKFVKPGPVVTKRLTDLPTGDLTDNSKTIEALLDHFRKFPDTLSDPDKTEAMIQRLNLSPAFQAVTLLFMEPRKRLELLSTWRENPQRMASLFIDRDFSMAQCYTGPWLPFMAIMQHDLPDPMDTTTAVALERHVQDCRERTNEKSLPEFPTDLMALWQNTKQLDLYGRSLWLSQKRQHVVSEEDSCLPSFRLKFRKKDLGPEPWDDFIREQSVLSFIETPEAPLTLESQTLTAGGVYRLAAAPAIFSQTCYVPEAFRPALEKCVHIEPDGSASVQMLVDTPGTKHYHHYPYLIDPASGLTRESALEGIRLYCRDSGKLWRMGIKSPDALEIFHNQAGSKPWNPLPGYALRRQWLFCTSSLCAWNSQIPDIAHAPAGMRDYQGVMAMGELPNDIYGERRFNWSDPLDMRRARLIELGKQFYGATLNWLRVRHDLNELNHWNPEHLRTLSHEMVTLYANLFSSAFDGDPEAWKQALLERLPAETLRQAARECLYWCSPQHPYVDDIRNQRFPSEVYPEHRHDDLKMCQDNLYEDGFKNHPDATGSNLGHTNRDNIVLHHLAAIFWFGLMEGLLTQKS